MDEDSGCIVGRSELGLAIIREYGGNNLWVSLKNDFFNSEDLIPLDEGVEKKLETSFKRY